MGEVLSNWFRKYFSNPEAFTILAVLFFAIVAFKTIGVVLAPLIVSIIITCLLSSLVKKLESWNMPHLLAVILVFVLFLSFLVLMLFWILPLLWQQLVNFFVSVPQIINSGQALLFKLQSAYPKFISLIQVKQIISSISAQIASLGEFVFAFSKASITGVITFTVYLVLVPLLVFFFLKDKEKLLKWSISFLPRKHVVLQQMWSELQNKIGCYVKGKIVEMFIVAIITIITFVLVGLNYAVLLGALVGVSVLIPYAGVIVVTIPIVIISLVQWGISLHFLYLMVFYAVIVTLDANVLAPILFSEVMDLHPVAIILGVLVFGSLGGFWGVFFAIPLVTLLHVLLKSWPRQT